MIIKGAGLPLDVWEQWSRKSQAYEQGECAKRWKSFHGDGKKVGTLVAFLGYQAHLVGVISALVGVYGEIAAARVGFDQLFTVMDTKTTVPDTGVTPVPEPLRGEVEFRGLTFAYEDEATLREVNFKVEPGQSATTEAVEEKVASRELGFPSAQDKVTAQSRHRGRSGGLPAMVGLFGPARDQRIASLRKGGPDKVLEFSCLVAAQGKPREIVALHEHADSQPF
jgi:hypothetical protein